MIESSVSSNDIKRMYGNLFLNSEGKQGAIPRGKMNSSSKRLRRIPQLERYAFDFECR